MISYSYRCKFVSFPLINDEFICVFAVICIV